MRTHFKSIFGWTVRYPDTMVAKDRDAWRYFFLAFDVYLMFLVALVAVGVASALTGCATVARPTAVEVPIPQVVESKVPVAMPCVKKEDVPVLPTIPSNVVLMAMNDFELLLTIEQLRHQLADYAIKADAVLKACTH